MKNCSVVSATDNSIKSHRSTILNQASITKLHEDFKDLIDTNYGASAGETEDTTLGNLVTRYCCYTEYLNPIS